MRVAAFSLRILLVGMAFAGLCAATGCDSADVAASSGAGSGGSGGAGGDGAGCVPNPIALVLDRYAGDVTRIHAPVTVEQKDALFILDTGSALTFLDLGPDGPEYVEHSADVSLGCLVLPVPGRGELPWQEDEHGQPVLGRLGADYLLGGTAVLDTGQALLERYPLGAALPDTEGYAEQPFEDVLGHIIAPVTLDGEPVRLMFDTGAQDTLWLGAPAQPGDVEVIATDATGGTVTLYVGTTLLELGGEPAVEVPVLRAPDWPYFEQTVAALGGDVHGLLGLSSLRGRTLVTDPPEQRLRLGPVP